MIREFAGVLPTGVDPHLAQLPSPVSTKPQPGVVSSSLMRRWHPLAMRVRQHINRRVVRRPWLLDAVGARLTVVDVFGTLGDTVLTAIVLRHLRQRYPHVKLNCVTANPELLRHDPNVDTVNDRETFFSVWSWYPELLASADGETNALHETFARLGMEDRPYEYRARVYLTDDEREQGRRLIADRSKPLMTFHTRSTEVVKDWPLDRWTDLVSRLRERFHLVHLGDRNEPHLDGVQRLAGTVSARVALTVLAHARIHLGGDSFLMHAANGLDVPAVIIFGGARTPERAGYAENINLFTRISCGPCWIHEGRNERCPNAMACMQAIAVTDVLAAVDELMLRR